VVADEPELTADEFARWWQEHEVARRRSTAARLVALDGVVHPFQYEVLHLPDEGLRMSLYVPLSRDLVHPAAITL